jgi:REP element-mobilizing transposase RayT
MTYNPTIHNRRSIRLQGYDYSLSGAYFLTICTYKKEHVFGEIVNGEIKLNLIGQYALQQWNKIPQRFPIVELEEFIIMPNHIHGIIIIRNGRCEGLDYGPPNSKRDSLSDRRGEGSDNTPRIPPKVSLSDPSPLHQNQPQSNGTRPGSVGAIVQNFKSSTSRKINTMPGMKNIKIWQVNYYDHIIRNEEDHARIVEYIQKNPVQWDQDELNSGGLL